MAKRLDLDPEELQELLTLFGIRSVAGELALEATLNMIRKLRRSMAGDEDFTPEESVDLLSAYERQTVKVDETKMEKKLKLLKKLKRAAKEIV